MECGNSPIKRIQVIDDLPNVVKSQRGGAKGCLANVGFSTSPRKPNLQCQNPLKVFGVPESRRGIYVRRRCQPLSVDVAIESRTYKYSGVGTPLEPSSPEGKFLSIILQNQLHLFKFAVEEQLDELISDRDEAVARTKQSSGSMESLLHRKIAEMKQNGRQIAVEDVIYMSIVHKFSEVGVPMLPKLSTCITDDKLEIWPSKCRELESIHSLEVQEMIRGHLDRILHMWGKSSAVDGLITTKIDRLHLGRIYAASILYGYFLKSACFRRQLDSTLACTQESLHSPGHGSHLDQSADTLVCDTRHEKLSSYVMGFDPQSFQICAKLKSKEAENVIEKHTWALFVDETLGELDCGNDILITFPSLERLVLEAVAFGSFLWDIERSVDSVYGLKEN